MRGAIEFGQREHIQDATTSKDMWDCLQTIHVTQRSGINVHYYYQELYTKKWDKDTTMSDHIGSFLQLHCHITESGQKLENIHIVYAILLSLSHSGIWDVVKQNLLDKGSGLTLNAVTANLLSVSDHIERERQLDESEKKQKADQLALLAKSTSNTDNPRKSKNMKKGKFKPKWRSTGSTCHTCGEKGHWSPKCPKKRKDKERTKSGGSAHIAIKSSGNCKIRKMLMALSTCCEIGQADMASITGATDSILLDCAATSHMFSEQHLFSFY